MRLWLLCSRPRLYYMKLLYSSIDWITSFFAGRSSCVVLETSWSHWALAPFGLPQGSDLAPLLCLLYTSDIGPFLSIIILWGIKPAVCRWHSGIFALPLHRGNGGRSYHAPGNGSPCRLDVFKPAPPQRPKNQIHLVGHQAAVGKAKPSRSLSSYKCKPLGH